jgi:hypothetical protein
VDLLARMLAERIDLTHPLLLTVGAKQLDIPTIKDLVTFVAEKFWEKSRLQRDLWSENGTIFGKMSVTRFGQLVIGPPGSGKTTYVKAMSDLLRRLNRKIAIVNLGKLLKGLSHELYWLLMA